MNQKILLLKGPDRARKRPAVIFGSDGIEGVEETVRKLLGIFATEAQLGHCKHLTVVHNGAQVELTGDGRGLYLGQDKGDDRVWKNIFTEFYCPPATGPDESGYSLGLHESSHHLLFGDPESTGDVFFPEDTGYFELCMAQYVSKYMDVVCVREGVKSTLHFEKGYNVGGISSEPTQEKDGTGFRFEMDGEVFTQTVIPPAFFLEKLEQLALLCPGLVCTYTNSGETQSRVFSCPGGVGEYVLGKGRPGAPVYSKKIEARGKERYNGAEYEAHVELAIVPAQSSGSLLCLHNYRELTYGGTHYRQLQEGICRGFNDCFLSDIIGDAPRHPGRRFRLREKKALTWEELREQLAVVLVSWCSPHCTAWENATRLSIRNKMITDMTHDAVSAEFCNYVYANKEALRPVVEAIVEARRPSLGKWLRRIRKLLFGGEAV